VVFRTDDLDAEGFSDRSLERPEVLVSGEDRDLLVFAERYGLG
jgi:hypothetical protein